MANILIIDDQEWVKELYKEGLKNEAHTVSVTDDVELVMKSETDLSCYFHQKQVKHNSHGFFETTAVFHNHPALTSFYIL